MARSATLASCLFLALACGLSACKKEKDTKATIQVLKENGAPVAGAYVKIYADPEIPEASDYSRLNKEGITDGGGRITFDYSDFYKQGQAGFAVLDLLATYDTLAGEGIIRIEEEQMNEETITVLPVE